MLVVGAFAAIASLVLGVTAAHAARGAVVTAGVAGLVAGAMSMAAGEYVSVASQRDVENADIERESEFVRDTVRRRAPESDSDPPDSTAPVLPSPAATRPWTLPHFGGEREPEVDRKEETMKACVGDMIEVRGRHVDDLPRRGEVLEVRGADGGPPYLMQWDDSPHVCIYYPGTDAGVHHFEHYAPARTPKCA